MSATAPSVAPGSADEWTETSLGEVAEFVMGQAPPGSECNKKGKGTLFVKAGEFGELYPVEREWTTKPLKFGQDGDVFICVVGATSGKLNLGRDCAIGRSVAAIRPKDGVDTKFIYYQLQPWVMKLRAASTGSAQGVISKAKLKDVPMKMVDEEAQKRIVAEIEKQLSRLDEAVASLKRVKANLKRYKAAVLKAAVEGKLTEDWRKQNPDVEPASKLLERILAERRTKWEEAELAKMKAKGKEPKNDDWKGKYKAPISLEEPDSVSIPDGWCYTSIGEVVECLDSIRKPINKKDRLSRVGEIPYYGANGQVGVIDDYLFDEPLVLLVEDETFVGRTLPFSYKISGKTWVNNHAHVLRPTGCVDLDYLNYSLMFYPFIPLTTGTTGRKKLTQRALMAAPYELPPILEQKKIIEAVEEKLSILDKVELELDRTEAQLSMTRQSVLAQAFAGMADGNG